MCINEKRILTIPSDLAYGESVSMTISHCVESLMSDSIRIAFHPSGDRGAGGVIPGKATLVFDVELLDIKNRKAEKQEL
jgi:hypothetical protein